MRVTMNTVYAGRDPETGSPLTLRPGEAHDFPDGVAKQLLEGNYATAETPAETETAPDGTQPDDRPAKAARRAR